MTRLTVIWTLFTFAITVNQVTARDFMKQALRNLQRHQAQHEHLQDNNQKDDSNHAVNLNALVDSYSVGPALYFEDDNRVPNQKHIQQREDSDDDDSLQDLRNLLELALNDDDARASKKDRKESQQKKQSNKRSKSPLLDAIKNNVFNQNRILEKRKQKSLLDVLGALKARSPASDDFKDSQVFMVIDSDAVQSGSEDNLNDLVSALLKSSLPSHKDREGLPEYRYKGFRVKVPRDSYRKARGDSNEKYASDDDDEIVRPKRPRAYVGKGRTAIPYIRNRGDIYEKDY